MNKRCRGCLWPSGRDLAALLRVVKDTTGGEETALAK